MFNYFRIRLSNLRKKFKNGMSWLKSKAATALNYFLYQFHKLAQKFMQGMSWLKLKVMIVYHNVKRILRRFRKKIMLNLAKVRRSLRKFWKDSRATALQFIALVGLVTFGLLTLKGFQIHDVGMSTLFPLGVFISVKLLVTSSNNMVTWPFLRRVFLSTVNFLWLGVWLICYLADFVGLGRGNQNG